MLDWEEAPRKSQANEVLECMTSNKTGGYCGDPCFRGANSVLDWEETLIRLGDLAATIVLFEANKVLD